jgi:hypothetical protein
MRPNWVLINIYNPYTPQGGKDFLECFKNVSITDDNDCLVVCDFNIMRSSCDRNKLGANPQEIFGLNESISSLRLVKIPQKRMIYTWFNMQPPDPLLE